jgi:hypothetical protein
MIFTMVSKALLALFVIIFPFILVMGQLQILSFFCVYF